MQKKAIITGGAGFLGRHLCRAVAAAGFEIKVIDLVENPDFPTTIADIRDKNKMLSEIKEADVVFHLAALIEAGESVKNPQAFIDTNITGSLNVMDAMKQNGIATFIFSSTAAVYGEPEQIPIVETQQTMPINPYGMTKLAIEGLLSSYVQSHGFTGIALRYFNLYGPEEHHDPETHAIPRFISQIHSGEEVTVWGEGDHQRDFIFISDIVEAHLKAYQYSLDHPNKFSVFNLSTEHPTTVLTAIQSIADALEKEPHIKHFDPRPGDPLLLYANASKAHEQLGWKAEVTFDEGIKKTVAYFLNYWKNLNETSDTTE